MTHIRTKLSQYLMISFSVLRGQTVTQPDTQTHRHKDRRKAIPASLTLILELSGKQRDKIRRKEATAHKMTNTLV